jgi:hypothetical protein
LTIVSQRALGFASFGALSEEVLDTLGDICPSFRATMKMLLEWKLYEELGILLSAVVIIGIYVSI